MKTYPRLVAVNILLFCMFFLSIQAMAAATAGMEDDIAFENSDFMQWSAYRNIQGLNPDSGEDGAYGPVNRAWDGKSNEWYIEEQRYGADLIAGGIARHNTYAIERGLLILRWGFQQQQPDGGFLCPEAFHSTSYFVEAVAHSLLLLRDSDYADQYIDTIKEFKPKLLAAARWLVRPDIETQGKQENAPFTYRHYLVAAALGESGILLNNEDLLLKAQDYARDGIKLQVDSGYNPERGGWDSSYQAVGMLYACRYYTIAAGAKFRPELHTMLEKAMRWEASRVDVKGHVTTDDNTLIGAGKFEKARSGSIQNIAADKVYKAFYYWSLISGDTNYKTLAQKIAEAAQQWHKPN